MVISIWMIGALWLIISILLYIFAIPKMFGGSLKNEWWMIKVVVFLMSMLIVQLGAFTIYGVGYAIISIIELLFSTDWLSFFNHEVIYIK
jgi:hypothetical protein